MKKIFYLMLFTAVFSSCDKKSPDASVLATTESANNDPVTEGTEINLGSETEGGSAGGTLQVLSSAPDENGVIDIYVMFENPPDIAAFNFELDFDENILELVSADANGYDAAFGKVALNSDGAADLKSLDKLTVSWASTNGADFPAAEVIDLLTAQFQLKSGAPRDLIEFNLSYNESDGFSNSKKEILKPRILNYSSADAPMTAN